MALKTCPACGQSMVGTSCSNCQQIQQKNQIAQEKSLKMQKKQLKMQKALLNNSSSANSGAKMHWKYFLIGGWILGIIYICLIIPILFEGGRNSIKKVFGYW